MKRNSFVPTHALAFFGFTTGAVLPAELSVKSFLGPPVGKTYTYRAESDTFELVGLSKLEQGVRVEERVPIPSEVLERLGNPHVRHPQSDLIAADGKLIKIVDSHTAQVLLQEPLIPRASSWTNATVAAGTGVKLQMICTIDSMNSEYLFNADRTTISVRCETEGQKPSLSVVTTDKYAEGIGLVEYLTRSMEEKRESYDKRRFVLDRIENTRQ